MLAALENRSLPSPQAKESPANEAKLRVPDALVSMQAMPIAASEHILWLPALAQSGILREFLAPDGL